MSSRRSSRELRALSASGALARPPGTTQAPQVLARIGRPAELERFPGGTAGKLGLLLAGNLAAIQAPDLLLGAQFPFLGKLLLAGTL